MEESSGRKLKAECKRLVRFYYDQGIRKVEDLMEIPEIEATWKAYRLSKDTMREVFKSDLNAIINHWVDEFNKRDTTAFKEQELFDSGFLPEQPETNMMTHIPNNEVMQFPETLILAIEKHLFKGVLPYFNKKPYYPADVYDRVDAFFRNLYREMEELYRRTGTDDERG